MDCTDSSTVDSTKDNEDKTKAKDSVSLASSSKSSSFADLAAAAEPSTSGGATATASTSSSSFDLVAPLMTLFREDKGDMSLEATKEILWENHFGSYGRGVHKYRTDATTKLVLKGIPDKFRSEIWMEASGAIHEKHANPGYYAMMVEQVRLKTAVIGLN